NLAILYEDNNHSDEAHRCLEAVLATDHNHVRARLYMKDVESARSMYYDDDDRRGDKRDAVLNIPITDFELSVRSRNCLKKMNIKSLGDLLRTSEQELLSYKNFGETSLNEIKSLLAIKGLRLGQALEGEKPGIVATRRPAHMDSRRFDWLLFGHGRHDPTHALPYSAGAPRPPRLHPDPPAPRPQPRRPRRSCAPAPIAAANHPLRHRITPHPRRLLHPK